MELSAYALHADAALAHWPFPGAATERVRVRGTTVTFSHRLAGALRPLPEEPSEEKCHNDRACGRIHPCPSEA
jgi:hypothetical protein